MEFTLVDTISSTSQNTDTDHSLLVATDLPARDTLTQSIALSGGMAEAIASNVSLDVGIVIKDLTVERNSLLLELSKEPAKENFDVSVQVMPDCDGIRINTTILRYSRVLDETIDKIGAQEQLPHVPLLQDHDGATAFVQFYWWATRDARFSITKYNLHKLLSFVDKFDVPLLAQRIILWTKSAPFRTETDFCVKMIFNCGHFDFLKGELEYWFTTLTQDADQSRLFALLLSPELEAQIGNKDLSKVVRDLVTKLKSVQRTPHAFGKSSFPQSWPTPISAADPREAFFQL